MSRGALPFLLFASLLPLGPTRAELGDLPLPWSVTGEGCTVCHTDRTGLAPDHAAIGCRICHLGDATTLHPERAHAGLARVPGDLSNARQTCGVCHPATVARVEGSLMATGRGIVAVDRWVFGEQATPDGTDGLPDLGDSPADRHARQLCLRCHLATPKLAPAPITERSRGGGCTACHRLEVPGAAHPRLTAAPTDLHCFGCHSRSGRISLSYAGWGETALKAADADPEVHRVLADGRVLTPLPADVHHARGMACVDCHTSRDTMGDGEIHLHQNDAVEIRCADCHAAAPPPTTPTLDPESAALVRLRRAAGATLAEGAQFVQTRRGNALHNVLWVDGDHVEVRSKRDPARTWRPRAPSAACADGNHDRLSCQACHTAWGHQCIGCHTTYDPSAPAEDGNTGAPLPGRFVETMSPPRFDAPVLGRYGDRVDLFVPGMIMQLDPGHGPKRWRLYAPAVPHTTAAAGRTCASCHRDPLAVGFGRGTLTALPGDQWAFTPEFGPLADGLPADAWTGVFAPPKGPSTTRVQAGPLSPSTQRRVLQVGRCLGCHDAKAPIYRDFARALGRRTPACAPR